MADSLPCYPSINMAWNNTARLKFESRVIDRCIFCGNHKEVYRKDFTIVFSEFEYNKGNICVDCYAANSVKVLSSY